MIREFIEKDAKEVSELITRNLIEINSKDYEKSVIDKFCVKYSPPELIRLSKSKKMFVFEEGNKIVGTGTLEHNYVNAIYVLPEFHRNGVGTKILKYLEELAKNNGNSWLKLHSTTNSLEFYKKNGYIIDHKVDGRANGVTYYMTKKF